MVLMVWEGKRGRTARQEREHSRPQGRGIRQVSREFPERQGSKKEEQHGDSTNRNLVRVLTFHPVPYPDVLYLVSLRFTTYVPTPASFSSVSSPMRYLTCAC